MEMKARIGPIGKINGQFYSWYSGTYFNEFILYLFAELMIRLNDTKPVDKMLIDMARWERRPQVNLISSCLFVFL